MGDRTGVAYNQYRPRDLVVCYCSLDHRVGSGKWIPGSLLGRKRPWGQSGQQNEKRNGEPTRDHCPPVCTKAHRRQKILLWLLIRGYSTLKVAVGARLCLETLSSTLMVI